VTIAVLDVNEPPIDITITDEDALKSFNISNPHADENIPLGTTIGTVNSYDEDYSASLSFSLDDDSNGTFSLHTTNSSCRNATNSKFKVHCKAVLIVAKPIDYESQSIHTIIVRVTDQGGLYRVQKFQIYIVDTNDAPTDILLNNKNYVKINEGAKKAQVIGQLQTIDEDIGQIFNYQILDRTLRKYFEITNDKLCVVDGVQFDYESQSVYNLTIRSSDTTGTMKSVTKDFQVLIEDVNEAPTGIILSSSAVTENSPPGTMIADITVSDPDNAVVMRQTHNCSLVRSSPTALGISIGNKLIVTEHNLDHEQVS